MSHLWPALLLLLAVHPATAASPVMRVLKPGAPGANLLRNGDFAAAREATAEDWTAWQNGYRVSPRDGRGASPAILCENRAATGEYGAGQTLSMERSTVAPIVVRGWSRAEGVSGSPDAGYSLYVDLIYTDGTPLWGQTAEFRCGTHDWEARELVIQPEKPVRTLSVYCLFRGHTGKVFFDDISVAEMRPEGGSLLFQGMPVQVVPNAQERRGEAKTFATGDGLRIILRDTAVTSLQIDGREVASDAPSGFIARDVAAGSDLWAFRDGACPELNLKLQAEFVARPDRIDVQGRLTDTTGRDRAVTLYFALPIDPTGRRWGDDIRRDRAVEGSGEYTTTVGVRCGATGTMAQYPLAALSGEHGGIALALDMGRPAVYRLAYHAGTKQFFIAYDFGLVKESERFPSSAEFRFSIYRFDPRWGFRAALQRLYDLYPDYFAVRSKEQGIWMPFTDIGTVEGWRDFGFRYHEGDNNLAFDDANDILSFRYTEPMTWWMPMAKDAPRTEAGALAARGAWERGEHAERRRMAEVSRVAGMHDADGRPALLFRNEPWADGAVWSLNPNPHLPGALNAATVHWNETIRERIYGPAAKDHQDGEYLDSLEGYVTAELNYRRDHFRHTTVPLTFASDTHRPALFKGLAVYEFTRWIADDVHRLGKLTFANGVPYRFSFLCPWLDVMGTETNWLRDGQYEPVADAQLCLWRALSGRKPYLLLMNTDFDRLTPDRVEKYFQRSLSYGFFPSMFSHNAAQNPYWRNPRWYNRDRPLFKKYIPIIRRVAEAGWRPIPHATCDNPTISIERFGPDASGAVYLTITNDSAKPQSGEVTLDLAALKLKAEVKAQELVGGKPVAVSGRCIRVELGPNEMWAVVAAP